MEHNNEDRLHQREMTADSYSVTKETPKEIKMSTVEPNGKPSEVVIVNIEDNRHHIFKCIRSDIFDKISCFFAELVGTGLLVYLGCMGCLTTIGTEASFVSSNLAFGLVVMIIIQVFGCVSGAHLNPSVTVAAVVYKLITVPMGVVYFVAQMIGAFIGFGMLKAVAPFETFISSNATGPGVCTTVPHADLHPIQAVALEFSMTMVLILVCCGVWDPRNAKNGDSVALKFGFTIAALGYIAGPLTGASMNPARSFAPAFWNGHFDSHWIYWVAPLSAGLITSLVYRAVFWRREQPEKLFIQDFSLRTNKDIK